MLSGNGTIDYSVEAHTLDVQETSAARQGSTTRNIHGSITKNFQTNIAIDCVVIQKKKKKKKKRRKEKSMDVQMSERLGKKIYFFSSK